jgi:four helix bundle protein
MNIPPFDEWVATQPGFITADPLWRVECYRVAAYSQVVAWDDCRRLGRHHVTSLVAPQLFRAIGSIQANVAEGYSRGSGRDRARLYEYGLGSTREGVGWYRAGEPVLGRDVVEERQARLQSIVRHLLVTIPKERRRGAF